MTESSDFVLFRRKVEAFLGFEASFMALDSNQHTFYKLELQKEEFKASWESVKQAYSHFLEVVKEDDEGKRAADLLADCRNAYITCGACIGEFYTTLMPRPNMSSTLVGATHQAGPSQFEPRVPSYGMNLPPCTAEIFYGDYLSWPSFRDMFKAVYVVGCPDLPPVKRLFYLRQSTRGEAHEIVKKIVMDNNGFELAWRNLTDRYENRRILVNSQLKVLFSLDNIKSESAQEIKRLQMQINNCIAALTLHGIDVNSWDPIFVFLCSTKLPENTLAFWEQSVNNKTEVSKWADLNNFLTARFQSLETVCDMKGWRIASSGEQRERPGVSSVQKVNRNVRTYPAQVDVRSCYLCSEDHTLKECQQFKRMNHPERFATMKRNNLCLNCFSNNHRVSHCPRRSNCTRCALKHHLLLHRYDVEEGPEGSNESSEAMEDISRDDQSRSQRTQNCFAQADCQVLLGTAVVHIVVRGVRYEARALIDSGSQASFISERLQKRLNLPVESTSAIVSGLNDAAAGRVQKECRFTLASPKCDRVELPVKSLVLPKLTGRLPSMSIGVWDPAELQRVSPLADPSFSRSDQVDILIGGDIYPQVLVRGFEEGVLGTLLGQKTIFGWILTGPLGDTRSGRPPLSVSYYTEVSLDVQLEKFWSLEEPPQASKFSAEDEYCEDLYKRTVKRNSEGRYVVSLPFKPRKERIVGLGSSRWRASRQFCRNEISLIRKPDLKVIYDGVLNEYLTLGHMVKVGLKDGEDDGYYLPHHAVFKPESSSTKVRVVFNASSRTGSGLSLNDCLYPGPVLQNDLTLLIIRWRFYRYVLNGDIEKMYRQILLEESQTKFQRVVFRKDPKAELEDFELQTVTFGVNCAPFLAIRTLIQLASDVEDKWPLAATILRRMMYVDDALVGTHEISLAIRARDELIKALTSAGFSMRKWASNDERILAGLPSDHLLRENFLEFEEVSTTKTLGIRWNAKTDMFYFITAPIRWKKGFTKREVLSIIASLFDPAGWLGPIVVVAKMLMQQIWSEKTGWDDQLQTSSEVKWRQFLDDYGEIDQIRIPRWVRFHPASQIQVHGFADASEKAYGACVYLRVKDEDGGIHSHLLVAKSKVAPLKTVSLPRLELCAALLLSNLLGSVKADLGLEEKKVEYFCWGDSTIVLAWLQRPPSVWTTFVANRVAKIVQNVGKENWRHVGSLDNPADIISRGARPMELRESVLWWHGPSWLKGSSEFWQASSNDDLYETEEESRRIQVCHTYIKRCGDVLSKFSSYQQALRVMAYVFRVSARAKGDKGANWNSELSTSEIQEAKEKLVIGSQKAYFTEEYNRLKKVENLQSRSSLLSLNPFLDEKGILRANGRLANAQTLPFSERCPVILPYAADFTRLLVSFVHKITLHGANSLMLRVLRAEFWIPRVKNLIRSEINRCKVCVIQRKGTHQQIMAALPVERTIFQRPFRISGVDFAGPYDIKNYTGRACLITKGYICIFVCFSTKAVHLEGVSDLSTQAFLAAFSRFVARRGCPLKMYSDNGTNFVGASKVLKDQFKAFLRSTKEATVSNYAFQNFSWHFNPAGAPHMGGLWEAGVKSLKYHFRREAGKFKYTFEEFSTLLCRIESCLNSRPLCPLSEGIDCLDVLTPGHFLIGGPMLAPPEPQNVEAPISVLNRWQRVKALSQLLCVRWKNEYLKELHKRGKWKNEKENVKENDMVVIKEDNLPPNEWRLGRVVKVCPGIDKRVRVAEIKTSRGLVVRPIVKLVVLP